MQPNSQAAFLNLIFMVLMVAIWYFILIRPQQKKQKDHQSMLDSLKKNAEVVTTSGIHGTIVNVKDKTFIVRIDDNVSVEIEKNCIAVVKKN